MSVLQQGVHACLLMGFLCISAEAEVAYLAKNMSAIFIFIQILYEYIVYVWMVEERIIVQVRFAKRHWVECHFKIISCGICMFA